MQYDLEKIGKTIRDERKNINGRNKSWARC